MQVALGEPFEVFQDVDGVGGGAQFPAILEEYLSRARFFIPIVTPSFLDSEPCRSKLAKLLKTRQKIRTIRTHVVTIYWTTCSQLQKSHMKAEDELAQELAEREFWDWRRIKRLPPLSSEYQHALETLTIHINRWSGDVFEYNTPALPNSPSEDMDSNHSSLEPPKIRESASSIIVSKFDGSRLSVAAEPPSGRADLEEIFEILRREVSRLVERGNLGNISPNIHQSLVDYFNVISREFRETDAILLGVEGELLRRKFEGGQEEVHRYAPEKKAQVEGVLLAHDMLVRRLPNWQAFLAEESELGEDLDDDAAEEIEAHADQVVDDWAKSPEVIDKSVPRTIELYREIKRSPGEATRQSIFALVRSIEDVLIAPMKFALKLIEETSKKTLPHLSKTLSVILTAGVVGAIMKFADVFPAAFGWVKQGVEFLKQIGLLTIG